MKRKCFYSKKFTAFGIITYLKLQNWEGFFILTFLGMCMDWFYELFLKSSQSGTHLPMCLILNQTHIKTKIPVKFGDFQVILHCFSRFSSWKGDRVEQFKRLDEGLLISSSVFFSLHGIGNKCKDTGTWQFSWHLTIKTLYHHVKRQNKLVCPLEPLPLRD